MPACLAKIRGQASLLVDNCYKVPKAIWEVLNIHLGEVGCWETVCYLQESAENVLASLTPPSYIMRLPAG